MNFFEVKDRSIKRGETEVYPDFAVAKSSDLMTRGKDFYAVWDESIGMWSTNAFKVAQIVDDELFKRRDDILARGSTDAITVRTMRGFSSNSWLQFQKYVRNMPDTDIQLDETLTFQDTVVKKEDYVSKRLPYSLKKGSYEAFDEIIGTLYDIPERQKLEWAIGSIVSGDAKRIQKFIVLYGDAGSGKSTIINIIEMLFAGYYTTFDAKALASSSNSFSTEVFQSDPLVAIQHDGDLSKIEDNTKLNSIVSHEEMVMNVKYKSSYTSRANAFLFMATNKPVKITDAKSGIIRRLIDVTPSGHKIPPERYFELMKAIPFELGAIAYHCLEVYKSMGPSFYSDYRPLSMIFKTDPFFNFVEYYYDTFKEEDGVSLARAYDLYNNYCDIAHAEVKLQRYRFREELKNYFEFFFNVTRINGQQIRSYYKRFQFEKFEESRPNDILEEAKPKQWLDLTCIKSLFDTEYAECPAQYVRDDGRLERKWENCLTKLKDISTGTVHHVKPPEHLIVVDFDLKVNGEKSREANLAAAAGWPPTYAEFSKSGGGVHLHYIYDGDVSKLSSVYSEGIEIKTFTGGASLRRKLSYCNDIPIATISSGLPLKEVNKTVNKDVALNCKALRTLILRACHKEYHPEGTKPNVDFIYAALEKAYESGIVYDVSDLKDGVYIFASRSSNNADYCKKLVEQMHFCSKDAEEAIDTAANENETIAFFDIESFCNLLLICWKKEGADEIFHDMVNPSPEEVYDFFNRYFAIGYNCRKYDNHVCQRRIDGGSIKDCNDLSQLIVNTKGMPSLPMEGYRLSGMDIFECCSEKKSLKAWECELGLKHHELDLPWDQPAPEELWDTIIDYCHDDVLATEALYFAKIDEMNSHRMLAAIANRPVNDKTNTLTDKIIHLGSSSQKRTMNWRNLAEPVTEINPDMLDFLKEYKNDMLKLWNGDRGSILPCFPGYTFENGISSYGGFDAIGDGGLVWADPGIYFNVWTFDVASMHPNSAISEWLMTYDTKNYADLVKARIYIKHKDYENAKKLFDGKLAPYLADPSKAKALSKALKIPINAVYGLTSASYDNPFYDIRNVDNIVAKRGALTMIDIFNAVREAGGKVIHIKTDSIKVVDPSPAIRELIMNMGKKYGYSFEIESIYEKICLVNHTVYIAKYAENDPEHPGQWSAVGAQFQHPYVFKTLFTHEPIVFKDYEEMKSVHGSSAIYIDANDSALMAMDGYSEEWLRNPELVKKVLAKQDLTLNDISNRRFVGKCGLFIPIKPGMGGGWLETLGDDGSVKFLSGSKRYRWTESDMIETVGLKESIDMSYYQKLVDDAVSAIKKWGDYEQFID